MSKFLTTAAMALALAGVGLSAAAQPPDDHHHDQGGGGQKPPPPAKGAPPKGGAPGGGAPGGQHGGAPAAGGGQHFTAQVGAGGGGGGQRGGAPGGRGGPPGMGFQAHGLRAQDQGRVTFRVGLFAPVTIASRRFHAAPPVYPGGWYYRSWAYGAYLPYGWYGPSFYLNWASYGLPPPPIGCEWVEQGPDAVLVDVWSGEVLSVYQNVFW